ncbi:MAG TPA: hypothetical protein VGH99_13435 [Pseudonocardia sp.]|jgi:hypothetical protein
MTFTGGNSVPTAGEIRMARSRVRAALDPPLHLLRTGALFGVGVLDLATDTPRWLRERVADRSWADAAGRAAGQARLAGAALTRRGERAVDRQRFTPAVRRALDDLRSSTTWDAERAFDEAHDTVEELLARAERGPRTAAEHATGLVRQLTRRGGRAS